MDHDHLHSHRQLGCVACRESRPTTAATHRQIHELFHRIHDDICSGFSQFIRDLNAKERSDVEETQRELLLKYIDAKENIKRLIVMTIEHTEEDLSQVKDDIFHQTDAAIQDKLSVFKAGDAVGTVSIDISNRIMEDGCIGHPTACDVCQGEEGIILAVLLNAWGNVLACHQKGGYEYIFSYYEVCVELLKANLSSRDDPIFAGVFNDMAFILKKQERFEQALAVCERSLAITRRVLNADHHDIGAVLGNMAGIKASQGLYEEAIMLYQEAMDISRRAFGEESLDIADTMHAIGTVKFKQGRLDEAMALFEESLRISRKVVKILLVTEGTPNMPALMPAQILGEDNLETADALNNMAVIARKKGNLDTSLSLHFQCLEIRRRVLGDTHPLIADTYNNIAIVLSSRGMFEEALALHEQFLNIRRATFGDMHTTVADSYNNIGMIYLQQQRLEEAEAALQTAYRIRRETLGEDHNDVGTSLSNIAGVMMQQDKPAEAYLLYEHSLFIRSSSLGENHPDLASTLNNMGVSALSQNKDDEALYLHQRSLDIQRNAFGEEHPSVATTLHNIGVVLEKQGKLKDALHHYEGALSIRQTHSRNPLSDDIIESMQNVQRVKSAIRHPSDAAARSSDGMVGCMIS